VNESAKLVIATQTNTYIS